jgi:hypothetical protein
MCCCDIASEVSPFHLFRFDHSLALFAQWTSPDTIGADELFWRGVLDPRDRALDQSLVGQPRLVSRRGPVMGIENPWPQRTPTEEAR